MNGNGEPVEIPPGKTLLMLTDINKEDIDFFAKATGEDPGMVGNRLIRAACFRILAQRVETQYADAAAKIEIEKAAEANRIKQFEAERERERREEGIVA
jgi:hypothetical protein